MFAKIKIKKSFTGKGMFAEENIKKGSKIIQYLGKKVTTKEANTYPNRYIFEIDENWSIDGVARYNLARYINHSCSPNAESVLEGDDRIFIFSCKNISAGEEITFDYGEDYMNDYIRKDGCKCLECRTVS